MDFIFSFWITKEEMTKKSQKSLKLSKIAVFCLLVNKQAIKIDHKTGNQKIILGKYKRNKLSKLQMAVP